MLDKSEIIRPFENGDIETARKLGPRIAAIGGGTGLSTMLRGFKEATQNITAIVTVADDGGGSGVLRHDLGMLPPGDIRNCILALANTEPTMDRILNYRFSEGVLAGQSFGNLFLAAMNGICSSFDEAVTKMSEVLAVTGRVLPVTNADVFLEAEFTNGNRVLGESKIFAAKKQQKCRIKRVRLVPEKAVALEASIRAIEEADIILLGPGSLYTSIIPNLLVEGVSEAVARSHALRVYVLNIMTQEGETEGYTAFDHVSEINAHARRNIIDVCIANSSPISDELMKNYAKEGAGPTLLDEERLRDIGIDVISRPVLSNSKTHVRHSPIRLAYEVLDLFNARTPRSGIYRDYDRLMHEHLRGLVTQGIDMIVR